MGSEVDCWMWWECVGVCGMMLVLKRLWGGGVTPAISYIHRPTHLERDEEAEAAVETGEGQARLTAEGGEGLVETVGERVLEDLFCVWGFACV